MIKKINTFIKKNIYIIIIFPILIILFDSFLSIYEKKDKILNKLIATSNKEKSYKKFSKTQNKDKIWADRILNKGGYILYFRHAEREKWIDVASYDALEMLKKIDARKSSFSKATCLSSKGLEQAKLMGEIIKIINLKIGVVISSPSCRAKETSLLAFKKVDYYKNYLLHEGPFNENYEKLGQQIRSLFLSMNVKEGKNNIISAHNGVITYHPNLFDENEYDDLKLDEGGFLVVEKKNNKLIVRHKFYNWNNFSRQTLIRPKN